WRHPDRPRVSLTQPREPSRSTKNDRTADRTSPTNNPTSPVSTSWIVPRMPPPNPLAIADGQSTPARADEPFVLVVTMSVPCFARTMIDRTVKTTTTAQATTHTTHHHV